MYYKQHLITVLGYIGIGFIGGSISHWFFSGTRSAIMAVLWIVMYLVSEYLKSWGIQDYKKLIVWGLIFSVAIGMISGGFQHFLDSPMRSLRIIPAWWIISTVIYPYKEWITQVKWWASLLVWIGIALVLLLINWWLLRVIPAEWFMQIGHH